MKHRTSAGLAAFALSSALVLTGCGDGDDSGADASASPSADASGASAEPVVAGGVCEPEAPSAPAEIPEPSEADQKAIEGVTVTGAAGEEPEKVEFDTPLEVEGLAVNVLDEGDGTELATGNRVTFQDYIVNGSDGEQTNPSTWDEGQAPQSFTLGDPSYQVLNEPFAGLHVGARLTLAMKAMDGTTQVHVLDIVESESLPTRAKGTTVKPEDGLPTVELGDDGAPTVTIADDYDDPEELVVQPLIEGDGAKVTKDDEVTVQYLGCLLDGTSFDSSWSRSAPTSFALSGVIPAWTDGLDGQKVGSQVLLVAPASEAYGEDPSAHELGGKTLIFVVDILAAEPAA
ncbi:FKBP-type peptidyl-prolyl cis-trans isomerase [Myceligenerans indicum]|uniref:peptidylprolyl isomerase n=1 Tax=Myceligenerans indicum TaxID=2593663 RepID=A0ABS1LI32_9MICO|nr:FKBP-type peptidyl-prolyl cis-trans isomerase [Myceligenerans indicum]MBL0885793.1 peptidylprolyl isomerase [Myceligenerans indicum]